MSYFTYNDNLPNWHNRSLPKGRTNERNLGFYYINKHNLRLPNPPGIQAPPIMNLEYSTDECNMRY